MSCDRVKRDKKYYDVLVCPVCCKQNFNFLMPYFSGEDRVHEFQFNGKSLVQCHQCGTIFCIPLSTGQSIERHGIQYYENAKSNDVRLEESVKSHIELIQAPHYDVTSRFFENHIDNKTYHRWLDVGSAGCPTVFENYDFTTVEPSPDAVNIGKKLYNPDKIVCGTIETFSAEEPFDGILFQNSFYYIPGPDEALKKTYNMLRNKGLVIIVIGQYFMEVISGFREGTYRRIEDIFRGNIIVYYNIHSLEYLFNKHGFRLLQDFRVAQDYGPRTVRYVIFEKTGERVINNEAIELSRKLSHKLLNDAFSAFSEVTTEALKKINNNSTIVIGTTDRLIELLKYGPLDKIIGFMDYRMLDTRLSRINGLNMITASDADNIIRSSEFKINLVLASWKHQQEILEFIQGNFDVSKINILQPSRESGIQHMDICFGGNALLSKGLELRLVPCQRRERSDFDQLSVHELIKEKITLFGSSEFLQTVYKAHLAELGNKSLVIWGTGGFFLQIKDIFKDATIEAFIDNNLSRQGDFIDGVPIKPPSYLNVHDMPVFICSSSKDNICQQIKKDYPHISLIP